MQTNNGNTKLNGTSKRVYLFNEGDKSMVQLLGNKGAHLAQMSSLGLPVPPGFTITTQVCAIYHRTLAFIFKCKVSISSRIDSPF